MPNIETTLEQLTVPHETTEISVDLIRKFIDDGDSSVLPDEFFEALDTVQSKVFDRFSEVGLVIIKITREPDLREGAADE